MSDRPDTPTGDKKSTDGGMRDYFDGVAERLLADVEGQPTAVDVDAHDAARAAPPGARRGRQLSPPHRQEDVDTSGRAED